MSRKFVFQMHSCCRVERSCGGSAQLDLDLVLRAKRLVIGGGSRVTILYFTKPHSRSHHCNVLKHYGDLILALLQSRSDIVAAPALNIGRVNSVPGVEESPDIYIRAG
jgi:hypothetical protein